MTTSTYDLTDVRRHRNEMFATIQACKACDRSMLQSPRTGEGPIPCERMILTDTPGSIQRDVLEAKFRTCGLPSLRNWYVTGAVKCRRDTPEPHQLTACHRNLRAELAVIDPQIVLLLGSHALHSTGISTPIGKCHGRPFIPPMGPFIGRTCFPTVHPNLIYKDQSASTLLTADLSTLYGLLSGRLNLSSVSARVGRNGKLDLSVEATDQ